MAQTARTCAAGSWPCLCAPLTARAFASRGTEAAARRAVRAGDWWGMQYHPGMRSRAARFAAPSLVGLLVAGTLGCANISQTDLDAVLGAVLGQGETAGPGLSSSTIVSGLKEALQVGTRNAVRQTSAIDGFWGDQLIRIAIPDELDTMARGLRTIGLGSQVDQFELGMNRAAERAAGDAFDVFVDSIRQMTFSDARGILNGPDDAATTYFRRTAGATLHRRFEPIVNESMRQVGLVRIYDDLLARWRAVPLAPQPRFDLDGYVTARAVDGLFTVVAAEEKKIRNDPAARVTELLRTVFGARE